MEFKDNLKELRKQQGLTQAQLAEMLFVSRSTVAKWENGLGLPSEESMIRIEELFQINPCDISTKDPEIVIMEKNKQIRFISKCICWCGFLILLALTTCLPFAINSGNYGLTLNSIAGEYADDDYIDTGDYRIFFFTFEGDFENGTHWSDLQGFKPVRKHFWGYTISDKDYESKVLTKDNYVVGRLYSIKGKNGYYNILNKASHYKVEEEGKPLVWDIPYELITATTISISGVEYELQEGSFFITEEPVRYFTINEIWYEVVE